MNELNNLNFFGTTYDLVDDEAIHEKANWSEADPTSDAYIENKPENLVQDADYVHTDNNFTTEEKTKLAELDPGQAKLLTTEDYNWNNQTQSATEPYNSVALWLLDTGMYYKKPQSGVTTLLSKTRTLTDTGGTFIVMPRGTNGTENELKTILYGEELNPELKTQTVAVSDGSEYFSSEKVITTRSVTNNLVTTSSGYALDARQGKVLKDFIDSVSSSSTTAITEEATARQTADTNLQSQIDTISASSDVTDIVGTYAELQNYDTSTLGDNNIIKVLQDENRNNETTYYRWSTTTQTFTLIGEEGPYYTKSESDTLLQSKQDILTAGENITILNNVISANSEFTILTDDDANWTDPDSGDEMIALWLLPTGMYRLSPDSTVSAVYALDTDGGETWIEGTTEKESEPIFLITNEDIGQAMAAITILTASYSGEWIVDNTNGLMSREESGPFKIPLVQTTGTSTTDVMSQNAVTSMVFGDPGTMTNIKIGAGAQVEGEGVSIGRNTRGIVGSVAIGKSAGFGATGANGYRTAIGYEAGVNPGSNEKGSISLGAYSKASVTGEMNIGSTNTSYGYNSSNYRLLTGLYDGQNAHDAVTVGQLNTAIAGVTGAEEINSTDWSALWQ